MLLEPDRRPSGEATSPPASTTATTGPREFDIQLKWELSLVLPHAGFGGVVGDILRVLIQLYDPDEGAAWPSEDLIGFLIGKNERTVRHHWAKVEASKLFTKLSGRQHLSNRYVPNWALIDQLVPADRKGFTGLMRAYASQQASGARKVKSSLRAGSQRHLVAKPAAPGTEASGISDIQTGQNSFPDRKDLVIQTGQMLPPTSLNDLSYPPSLRETDNEAPIAGALAAPLAVGGASLEERPAAPVGIPMPGYDSKTFAERLPSFATKWPEAEPRPRGIPSEELTEWCETLASEWQGKKHDVRGAVAELMMLGWSLDQLADPIHAYNDEMRKLKTYTMRFIAYLGDEFDVGGKHRKAWEAERAGLCHREDKAPAVIEKVVREAPKAEPVAEHQVEHQVAEHQAEPVTIEQPAEPVVEQPVAPVIPDSGETVYGEPDWNDPYWIEQEGEAVDEPAEAPQAEPVIEQPIAPVVTIETTWGEPEWGELDGDNTDEPVESSKAEPVIEVDPILDQTVEPPAAEGKAGDDTGWGFDDAFADMTQAEQQAVVAQKAKEVRAKYEADRRARETPSERADRELAEYLKKRREKNQAEAKRKKLADDRAGKPAIAPASIYPLRAPRGISGGLRRMSDYQDATF